MGYSGKGNRYTVKRLNAIKNSGNLVPGQTIRLPMISK